MSTYNPFAQARAKESASKSVEVEGVFQCQVCDEAVYTAKFVSENSVLTWKCGTGHVSVIEGFNLYG